MKEKFLKEWVIIRTKGKKQFIFDYVPCYIALMFISMSLGQIVASDFVSVFYSESAFWSNFFSGFSWLIVLPALTTAIPLSFLRKNRLMIIICSVLMLLFMAGLNNVGLIGTWTVFWLDLSLVISILLGAFWGVFRWHSAEATYEDEMGWERLIEQREREAEKHRTLEALHDKKVF